MTPAEELWQAVVKHCATGRGYRIALDGTRLTLTRPGERGYFVEPEATGNWIVASGFDVVAVRNEADSAVWFAVERVTE